VGFWIGQEFIRMLGQWSEVIIFVATIAGVVIVYYQSRALSCYEDSFKEGLHIYLQ
jgi:hypothetical protein